MQELHGAEVDITTPGGKAMFQMLGVFGEFERADGIVVTVDVGARKAWATAIGPAPPIRLISWNPRGYALGVSPPARLIRLLSRSPLVVRV